MSQTIRRNSEKARLRVWDIFPHPSASILIAYRKERIMLNNKKVASAQLGCISRNWDKFLPVGTTICWAGIQFWTRFTLVTLNWKLAVSNRYSINSQVKLLIKRFAWSLRTSTLKKTSSVSGIPASFLAFWVFKMINRFSFSCEWLQTPSKTSKALL